MNKCFGQHKKTHRIFDRDRIRFQVQIHVIQKVTKKGTYLICVTAHLKPDEEECLDPMYCLSTGCQSTLLVFNSNT